jgi:hypothetical protein
VDFSFRQAFKAVNAARKTREKDPQRFLPAEIVTELFLQQELLPVTNYLPDVEAIRKNSVRIYMAAGKRSLDKKRFYAQTARILADRLGCELVVFPGHHGSFVDMPNEWAAVLRDILRSAHR